MGYALTEEQQLIQQTARDFALEYIAPHAAEIDRTGAYPAEIVGHMAEHDFMGLFLPTEFGGSEAGYLSYVLVMEQLSRVSGAVGAVLANHCLAAYALNRWGTDEQKHKYLTALSRGEILGAVAIYEPKAAPGIGAERVTAERDGENYVLNGRKVYVPNGGVAGIYVVLATTNPMDGCNGLCAFIVEENTLGLKVDRTVGKMGLRGCQCADIVFENVRVPAANMLGKEGSGSAFWAELLAVAGVAEGAQVVGIAQVAMEEAAKYAKQRVQFGRPIAKFPAIQNMLAEMATNIHLTRLAVYHAASLIDSGEPFAAEAAMIRLFAGRIGQSALIDAIQIEGGYGYSEEMPVSRFYRDIKGVILKNNSAEFPEQIIAGAVLD